jgi:hypothetical protein
MDAKTIKQIDELLSKINLVSIAHTKIFPTIPPTNQPNEDGLRIAKTLENDGLIKTQIDSHFHYKITLEGIKVRDSPNGYAGFLAEKEAEEQKEKDILDAKQAKQEAFWKSGVQRDKRQKWQYWVTTAIAIVALGLSLFNFIKNMK